MNTAHEREGYGESVYGSYIAYHFMVGKDGTVLQLRALDERTGHTRNQITNLESIAIVVTGNFENEYMTSEQLDSVHALIKRLDAIYHFERIIPHRGASPTSCPGKNLVWQLEMFWRGYDPKTEIWNVTRYYSPEPDQLFYYHGSYLKDVEINCGLNKDGTAGDCYHTADGTDVRSLKPFTMVACPKEIPFGTKFLLQGYGEVTCHDRGGAITSERLDLWAGAGSQALHDMRQTVGGYLNATRL